jgi:putative ABC transport system ATP-binding protein
MPHHFCISPLGKVSAFDDGSRQRLVQVRFYPETEFVALSPQPESALKEEWCISENHARMSFIARAPAININAHPGEPIMIEVRNLTKTLTSGAQKIEILRGIDLTIHKGEVLAVEGPSGSGKSTLLGLLAGFDSPTSGSIKIDGEEITSLNEDQLALLRGKKLGFVFQSYNLIPTLTAEENVALPLELRGDANKPQGRARELLSSVGLETRLSHYPVQLSGGEQQRVALARAFACSPSLLLADEPTGNLDSATGSLVLEMLLKLNRSQGATLVIVTHDPALSRMTNRVVRLRDGRIISDAANPETPVEQAIPGKRQ